MDKLLKNCLPRDHSRQVNSNYFIHQVFLQDKSIALVVDLGCGKGNSVDTFRKQKPDIKWIGVDIAGSPEARSRRRTDAELRSFDGIHIPLRDCEADLVFCRQVLEYVAYPRELITDVYRILRPGGYLVGSTSQFEPFHSYSLWNYTPYGFYRLVQEAGLCLIEIRPGIRRYLCR